MLRMPMITRPVFSWSYIDLDLQHRGIMIDADIDSVLILRMPIY